MDPDPDTEPDPTPDVPQELAYRSERPILLVHGAWHGSWCWNEHWTPHLRAAGFPVRSISLPKHRQQGSSRRIWPSLGKYVRHVRAHLEELGPETVLIGHSMGGLVVQRALERRTAARGAILVASVPRNGVGAALARQFRSHPGRTLRVATTMTLWPLVSDPTRVREAFFTETTSNDIVEAAAAQVQNESYRAFLSMLLRRSVPRRINVPVGVIAAERDAVFTLAEQRQLADGYGADLRVIDDAGHDLMLDPSWREAVDHVITWIDEH